MSDYPVPTWSVASTVREPLPLVLAFSCYHLALGAKCIHLFFDDPNDPAAKVLETIDGIHVTRCDAAYWAHQTGGKAPPRQGGRQSTNVNLARRDSNTDLILHIDADEFLWAPSGAMAHDFSFTTPWLHIPNLERCWGPSSSHPQPVGLFDGKLRAPIKDRGLVHEIYGDTATFLSGGLGGHSSGKSLTRRESDGYIGIHVTKNQRGGETLPHTTADHLRILHFDGITPLHWAYKSLRYAAKKNWWGALLNNARQRSMAQIVGAEDPLAGALEQYEKMFCLSKPQVGWLTANDVLMDMPIDPLDAISQIAPDIQVDLTCAAFDAHFQKAAERLSQRIRSSHPKATSTA